MNAVKSLGRILTFYSYKGGTGRSMALANIAWILASSGRRVLMIDWDLEAPGLHRYFRPFLLDDELTASDGIIDLVDRYANEAIRPVDPNDPPPPEWYLPYADFSDDVLSINFNHFGADGRLDFLPAGRQGDAYGLKVSSFNWQNFYDRLGGGGFFEAFKRKAREEYDYVLIDSRTGVSDTAGICSVQMPDTLVACFTYNNQSIKGASSISAWAKRRQEQLVQEHRARASATLTSDSVFEDSPRTYRVFPVPMRVDVGESDRLALRQAFAREAFRPLVTHLGADQADYWLQVEVPHNAFYSYEEVLAPFKDSASDPKTVLSAFLRITGYITDRDVSEYRLTISPEERLRLLEAFAVVPPGSGKPSPSAIATETDDELLVRSAEAALAAMSESQKPIAHRVFRRLVRVGRDEEGGGLSPIVASFSDFTEAEHGVIAALEKQGILSVTSGGRPGRADPAIGFADPRLVSMWKTLITTVEGDRDFLQWRQQVRVYMTDWERSMREPAQLLSGRLLSEALTWVHRRPDDLNAAEQAYLKQSVAAAQTGPAPTPVVKTIPYESFESTASVGSAATAAGKSPFAFGENTQTPRSSRRAGVGTGLVLAASLGLLFYFYWLANGPRSDVVVAAASATTDPLQQILLLLELNPDSEVPPKARDLALELTTATVPVALFHNEAHRATVGRFGSDGQTFVVGSADGSVTIWRPERAPQTLVTHVGSVVSVSANAEGRRLLITGQNHVAEMWDVDTNRLTHRVPIFSDLLAGTLVGDVPVIVQPAPAGGEAIGQFLGQVSETFRDEEFKSLVTLPRETVSVAFSADGSSALAMTTRGLQMWQLPSGSAAILAEASKTLHAAAISSNGAFAAASYDTAIQVWSPSAAVANEPATVPLPRISVPDRVLAVSPDGQIAALTFSDRFARLIPVKPGIASPAIGVSVDPFKDGSGLFSGHKGQIIDIDFSLDGTLIATSGSEGTSRIWRNPTSRRAVTRPAASSSWNEVWTFLRAMTTACLTSEERSRLLNENAGDAEVAALRCEVANGATLLWRRPSAASSRK